LEGHGQSFLSTFVSSFPCSVFWQDVDWAALSGSSPFLLLYNNIKSTTYSLVIWI
jgi:hypothetical protein